MSLAKVQSVNERRQGFLWNHIGNDGLVVRLPCCGILYFLSWGDVMSFWVVLNIFFAWLMLKWAKADFENGRNGLGWMNIVFSAFNAAAAANAIF